MAAGQIVRVYDRGDVMQILCTNERELRSIYFERRSFYSFSRAIQSAGLKIVGLYINFERGARAEKIRVPALGCDKEYYTHKRTFWSSTVNFALISALILALIVIPVIIATHS